MQQMFKAADIATRPRKEISVYLFVLSALLLVLAAMEFSQLVAIRLVSSTPVTDPVFRWNDILYYWFAGKMWASGESAYAPLYSIEASKFFEREMNPFYYPPNNYFLCRALATMEPLLATKVWFAASTTMFVIGSVMAVASVFPESPPSATTSRSASQDVSYAEALSQQIALVALISVLYLFACNSTSLMLKLGQTTSIVFLGYCLIIASIRRMSMVIGIFGVTLTMLKPQFGVPLSLALLFFPQFRIVVISSWLISALIAVPALLSDSPLKVVEDFLQAVSGYGSVRENQSYFTIGAAHLLGRALDLRLNNIIWLAITSATVLLTSFAVRYRSRAYLDKDGMLAALHLAMICVLMIMPLHEYDMVLVVPIIVQLVLISRSVSIPALVLVVTFPKAASIVSYLMSTDGYFEITPVSAIIYTALLALLSLSAWLAWHGVRRSGNSTA
jgi:glycosyl transferase family 87